MPGTVKIASPGLGFDVNQPLSAEQAIAFKGAGYLFVVRYLPRTPALIKGNLSDTEITAIQSAGLCLMAVQHVPNPGWNPSAGLGTQYGEYTAVYAAAIGLLKGMNLWLDLEEVATGTTVQDVIDYCTAWFNAVSDAGYVPGLYCGWNIVLTAQQLYNLPFKHYWKAYNYDNGVATRGFQLIQKPQQVLEGVAFDPDILRADNLGMLPLWLSPE